MAESEVPGVLQAPPIFVGSDDPIPTKGAEYANHIIAGTPNCFDIPPRLSFNYH